MGASLQDTRRFERFSELDFVRLLARLEAGQMEATEEIHRSRYEDCRGRRAIMTDPAAFVAHFGTIWAKPMEHLDTFLDFLSPDIRLTAPVVGTSVGREAGYRAFRDAFGALPDLRGRVLSWSAAENDLYIEMEFSATIGGRRVTWLNVDRFRFEGDVAVERRAFFDPLLLLGAFLRRPSGWRQLWRLARG